MMTVKDLMTSECQSSPDGKHWEPTLPSYLGWRIRLRDAWDVFRGKAVAVRQTTKEDIEAIHGIKERRNLKSHALAEFRASGWMDEAGNYNDKMQQAICNHVLKLLDVFADEGHSGSSASYAVGLFEKLAMFKPIVPLTGEDWEWDEVSDGTFQNKRCGRVFKRVDRFNGQAYDTEGRVFYEWNERPLDVDEPGYPGTCRFKSTYISSESRVPIIFPYTPTTEYVGITKG